MSNVSKHENHHTDIGACKISSHSSKMNSMNAQYYPAIHPQICKQHITIDGKLTKLMGNEN